MDCYTHPFLGKESTFMPIRLVLSHTSLQFVSLMYALHHSNHHHDRSKKMLQTRNFCNTRVQQAESCQLSEIKSVRINRPALLKLDHGKRHPLTVKPSFRSCAPQRQSVTSPLTRRNDRAAEWRKHPEYSGSKTRRRRLPPEGHGPARHANTRP